MKTYIIILITLFTNYIVAQKPLDTIYANDNKNVALFFSNPIRQGITGKDNFVFTYNREKQQYFGLLQAAPGTESNLLAITNNGQIYSYILKYKEQLTKLNYFIPEAKSIGNENPLGLKLKQIPISKPTKQSENRVKYFQRFSDYLLKRTPIPMATKRKKASNYNYKIAFIMLLKCI